MAVRRHAGVTIRIFVPEEVCLVARTSHVQRIEIRPELAGRVEHARKLRTDRLANAKDIASFLACVTVVPAMDLESNEARCLARDSEIRERRRAAQTSGLELAVVCARVGGKTSAVAAKQFR